MMDFIEAFRDVVIVGIVCLTIVQIIYQIRLYKLREVTQDWQTE